MSETYTIGGDTYFKLETNAWVAQSFSPRETHTLKYIDLNIKALDIKSAIRIRIYYSGAEGKPILEHLLSAGTIPPPKKATGETIRARAKMTPYELNVNEAYVIVCQGLAFPYPNNNTILYDAGDATYPRGFRMSTDDSGDSWAIHLNDDLIFTEFGTPPLPLPEPPPPIEKFAVPAIFYTHYDVGLVIRIPTSVPCHLTCYYTDKTPLKHPTSRTIRGLKVPWGTYFCFVAWKAVEQSEPGDTLYHTFHFPEWPTCLIIIPEWDMSSGTAPPYWEPWGTTLTENNQWEQRTPFIPISYTITDGIIHLYNPSGSGAGILCPLAPSNFPLQTADDAPICFTGKCPSALITSSKDYIAYFIDTYNGVEFLRIELIIARGDLWGDWGTLQFAYAVTAGKDYGLDPGPINILDFWRWAREQVGKSADPTGWFIEGIHIAFESEDSPPIIDCFNDHINLFYATKDMTTSRGNERHFTFRGEVDLEESPSVGPIFQHCHPGADPPLPPLRPNAPGDLTEIPFQIPNFGEHWDKVDEVTADEDATYVHSNKYTPAYTGYKDFYNLNDLPDGIFNIAKIEVTVRWKLIAVPGATVGNRIGIKTGGTEYWSPTIPIAMNVGYVESSYEWITNPQTGKPWTVSEINALQAGVRLTYQYYWWTGDHVYFHCTQVYVEVTEGIKGGPD